jgi:hypothetical protein
MRNIQDLLKRFTNSLNQDSVAKGAIKETIRTKIGVSIPEESISIKIGVLEISASPIVKNEIRMKVSALIIELRGNYNLPISSIRYK